MGATPSELPRNAEDARDKRKGHGRLPVCMYKTATHIVVPHQSLHVGAACPACRFGRLYELRDPAQYLRIRGQPLLAGTCWDCQRLRCASCGDVHTAKPPTEALGPKFDESAVAMIALCRYGVGLPPHGPPALAAAASPVKQKLARLVSYVGFLVLRDLSPSDVSELPCLTFVRRNEVAFSLLFALDEVSLSYLVAA